MSFRALRGEEMSTDNVLARTSAALVENQTTQTTEEMSNSHSINTLASVQPEYVISEDLIAGQRLDGRMSNVRRFFCLFVTFDLLFTCLLWIICIVLNGENIKEALMRQVVHFDIHTSLFDVVLASICRFTVLLLFYALLYINHWAIISISTAGTCVFLICKVFVFNWTESQQPVFQVLLILASFILAWSEAWFLDFRVLPQEMSANRYLVTTNTERTPLIRNYIQGLPSLYNESVGNFYSPMGSSNNSMLGDNLYPQLNLPNPNLSAHQISEFKRKGIENLEEAWKLINSTDWKKEKECQGGGTVDTMKLLSNNSKIYRLTAVIESAPKFLLDELFYRVEEIPKWSNSLLESRKLQVLDEQSDVTYQVSCPGGKGLVSSRDFVNLRHWTTVDGCYVSVISSVTLAAFPETNKYVRGENGVSCIVMRPIINEPNSCVFQWLLNTDLKLQFPSYMLTGILSNVMVDYLRDLRNHMAELRSTGKIS